MSDRYFNYRLAFAFSIILVVSGCSSSRTLHRLESERPSASINIIDELRMTEEDDSFAPSEEQQITLDHRKMTVMQAVYDASSGEMVANERIKAAVVTARFLNVAERDGKVTIGFEILVPEAMQDNSWQVRFHPKLEIGGDTMRLEQVMITGSDYRNRQLRGYELYNRFIAGILDDKDGFLANFVHLGPLETFIERNLPALWKMKSDSTMVEVDSTVTSLFGLNYQQIVDHYTRTLKLRWNTYKKNSVDRMYRKYVKDPFITEGVRLDSVIHHTDGELSYHYSQTIPIDDDIRKVFLSLDGDIWKQGERIYTMPECPPLTYYISTLASMADRETRYRRKVILRNATVNGTARISFPKGKYEYDASFGDNASEMERMKGLARDLIFQDNLILDSIRITATCSPEGIWRANETLANRRSREIESMFRQFVNECRREREMERMRTFSLDSSFTGPVTSAKTVDVTSGKLAEDWPSLERICRSDPYLERDLEGIEEILSISDPDLREKALSTLPVFGYIRDSIYPALRKVDFSFCTHIPNMLKDTVYTDEVDTLYMSGLEALSRHDYKTALTILRPYEDINSAIALLSLNYNHSALEILGHLEQNDTVLYLEAVLHHRLGRQEEAERCYLDAITINPRLVHRANLDPEISSWSRKYADRQ